MNDKAIQWSLRILAGHGVEGSTVYNGTILVHDEMFRSEVTVDGGYRLFDGATFSKVLTSRADVLNYLGY